MPCSADFNCTVAKCNEQQCVWMLKQLGIKLCYCHPLQLFFSQILSSQPSSDLGVWMQKEEWSSADKTLKVHKSRLELAKEQAAAARSRTLPLSLQHARLL